MSLTSNSRLRTERYLARALGVVARARNMSQLARDTGLTREGVRKALAPGGNPSYATVAKVAKALGFRLTLAPMGEVLGKSQDPPLQLQDYAWPEIVPVGRSGIADRARFCGLQG